MRTGTLVLLIRVTRQQRARVSDSRPIGNYPPLLSITERLFAPRPSVLVDVIK